MKEGDRVAVFFDPLTRGDFHAWAELVRFVPTDEAMPDGLQLWWFQFDEDIGTSVLSLGLVHPNDVEAT